MQLIFYTLLNKYFQWFHRRLSGKNFRFNRGFMEDSCSYLTLKLRKKMKEFFLKQLFNHFKTVSYF